MKKCGPGDGIPVHYILSWPQTGRPPYYALA
jgi:hypothetical protein